MARNLASLARRRAGTASAQRRRAAALRQKIPGLSQDGIENLDHDSRLDVFDLDRLGSGLTKGDRKTLTKDIVEQFATPEQIALRLLASGTENAFMEERFAHDLAAIAATIKDEHVRGYAELEEQDPDMPLQAFTSLDGRLGEKKVDMTRQLYEGIVGGAGIFKSMA